MGACLLASTVYTKNRKKTKLKYFSKTALFLATFFAFLFLSFSSTQAAITKQIGYQGRLTNDAGNAVADGTYNIIIRIYDDPSSGNCVWSARGDCSTPTARQVTVTGGVFSIMLGDTSAGDNALNLTFNSGYYLGIKIGNDNEMTPRKTMGAVSAAFNSDLVDGLDSATSGTNAHIVATDASAT